MASAPDFDHSDAPETLPARGYDTWTRAVLDAFLRSPEELVPRTTMTFVGMPESGEWAELIAWLARTGVGSGEE